MQICIYNMADKENNIITGGSNFYYMKKITDELCLYLRANGILYTVNDNSSFPLHKCELNIFLDFNSNESSTEKRGINIFSTPDRASQLAGKIILSDLKTVYPLPSHIKLHPLNKNKKGVFLKLCNIKNKEDSLFISDEYKKISKSLALSVQTFFNTGFSEPFEIKRGVIKQGEGSPLIFSRPYYNSLPVLSIPENQFLLITGQWHGWYTVNYRGIIGFIPSMYVKII